MRTPLCKFTAAFFLLSLAFSLTGCLQVRYLVSVNPDGSGTVEERVMMASEMRAMMESMQAMFDEGGEPIPPLLDEDELRSRALQLGEGVEYTAAQTVSEEGYEGYVATYAFSDINNLNLNLKRAAEGVEGAGPGFGSPSGGGARFSFQPGSPATLFIHRMPDEPVDDSEAFDFEWDETEDAWDLEDDEELSDSEQELMMEQARAFLGGMRFVMEVEVNGSITETDAQHLNGNRITLVELDLDRLMEVDDGLRAFLEAEDLSEAEVLSRMNMVPGVRMEPSETVRVVFQ